MTDKKKPVLSLTVVMALIETIGEWLRKEIEEVPVGYLTKEFMGLVLGCKPSKLPREFSEAFETMLYSRRKSHHGTHESIRRALMTVKSALESWAALLRDRKESYDQGNRMAMEMGQPGMIGFGQLDSMSMVELEKIGPTIESRLAEIAEAYGKFQTEQEIKIENEAADVVRAKKAAVRGCEGLIKNIHFLDRKPELGVGVDMSMSLEAIQQRQRFLEGTFDRLVEARDYSARAAYRAPSKSWIDLYRVNTVKAANPVARPKSEPVIVAEPFVPKQLVEVKATKIEKVVAEPERKFEELSLFDQCQWLERKLTALGKPVSKKKLTSSGMQTVNLERRKAAMLAQVAQYTAPVAVVVEKSTPVVVQQPKPAVSVVPVVSDKLEPLRKRRERVLILHREVRGREMSEKEQKLLEVKNGLSDASIVMLSGLLGSWERTLHNDEKRSRQKKQPASSSGMVKVMDETDVAAVKRALGQEPGATSKSGIDPAAHQNGHRDGENGKGKRN